MPRFKTQPGKDQGFSVGSGAERDGDGRSDFHTRVKYRMNVFRHWPASN